MYDCASRVGVALSGSERPRVSAAAGPSLASQPTAIVAISVPMYHATDIITKPHSGGRRRSRHLENHHPHRRSLRSAIAMLPRIPSLIFITLGCSRSFAPKPQHTNKRTSRTDIISPPSLLVASVQAGVDDGIIADSGDSSLDEVDLADVPVTEEIPVPNSRNNVGNRFVALVYDRTHSDKWADGDAEALWDLHDERIALTEDHVMWARKQNLYNETFNTESMADILWSHQL